MPEIYRTPQVEQQYKRIFKESAKLFVLRVAKETQRQILEAE